MNKFMMATQAMHKLGDISRDEGDLCVISSENNTHYIGRWVTGFGFIDVEFPKETTRKLTAEEVEYYNKQYVQLSNHPPKKLVIKEE